MTGTIAVPPGTAVDPDQRRAASHRHMIDHLAGPFASGAVDTPLAIDASGHVTIDWRAREPLLLVAPAVSLGELGLRIRATFDPDGAATSLPDLTFAPYTEAGTFLPLHRPPADEETRTASPFSVALTLAEAAPDGAETPVPSAEISAWLDVRLLEGVMGRLIYALGAEKARLRRMGRELAAMRLLPFARDAALDHLGGDFGVPRFAEDLAFQDGQLVTATRREPDAEYRRRLGLYRPFVMPSRSRVLSLLNGHGAAGDPNTGPLGQMGLQERFSLVEETNPFAVAIKIVGDPPSHRAAFFNHLREVYLVEPGADVPAARFLPSERRARENALRARLRQAFTFPAGAAIAPALASALDRVGRCRRALGAPAGWPVRRAQDDTAGSRYELGLGVDVRPRPASELNAMVARLQDPQRPPATDDQGRVDEEIEALLRSMSPQRAAQDPEGNWLLAPCGIRTVHRVNTATLYLSHFPSFGLVITSPNVIDPSSATATLEARYEAPGDPGKNVVLHAGLAAALAAWTGAGRPAWTELDDTTARSAWDQAQSRPAGDPALQVFAAAGLPVVTAPQALVERLKRLPNELVATLRLHPNQTAPILAGEPAAIDDLRRLLDALRTQHLSSAVPLITAAGEVLLVVAVIGLPEAGINLAERRATGFRWYAAPILGTGGALKSVGSRTTFTALDPGQNVTAIVVLGYARRGQADPYEYRVELPEGALLSLKQYEYLMNVLERAFPIGVEVNTFSVRRRHVDLDGDGAVDPLLPAAARTYRPFRRPRQRGEAGVTLE